MNSFLVEEMNLRTFSSPLLIQRIYGCKLKLFARTCDSSSQFGGNLTLTYYGINISHYCSHALFALPGYDQFHTSRQKNSDDTGKDYFFAAS